jgi:hypothetical protein
MSSNMNVHKTINSPPLAKDLTMNFLFERGRGADPEGVQNLCFVLQIYVTQIISKSPNG